MKFTIRIWAKNKAVSVAHALCNDAVMVRCPGNQNYVSSDSATSAHISSADASNAVIEIVSNYFLSAQGLLEWMNIDLTLINPETRTQESIDFDGQSYLEDKAA